RIVFCVDRDLSDDHRRDVPGDPAGTSALTSPARESGVRCVVGRTAAVPFHVGCDPLRPFVAAASVLRHRQCARRGFAARSGVAGPVPHALALTFTFAAIAVALGLAGRWITVAWAAEGAAVIWVGLSLRRTALRYGGTFLLALAIVRLAVWQFGETLASFK